MVDRLVDPEPRVSAAGPAVLILAICVAAASLIVLDGARASPPVREAAFILWWSATGFWFLTAVTASRRGQGLWVLATAPLVLFPLAVYGLLVAYRWESCDL